jgi:zinc protease
MRKAFLPLLVALTWLAPSAASAIDVSFERDTTLPLVHINLAVRSGAVTDPQGLLGLTNFTADMLLRGTRTRTKEQIDLTLDQLGAVLETETRAESIVIRGAVLSSNLPQFLSLLTEIVTQPSFPEREIQKLKAQTISGILEELSEDSSLAARRFNHFLFRTHPYGNPVDGTQKDVERFTRQKVAAHYDRLFRDGAFVVVGTGDAKVEDIETWAKGIAAARPGKGADRDLSTPTDTEMRRLTLIDKPGRTQAQVFIGQTGVKLTDPEYFPLYIANHAFGGESFTARLMTELRVKRGWTYGAYSTFRIGTVPRSWMVHSFPGEKDASPAVALTLKMIQDLRDHGISKAEFEFSKQSLIKGAGFAYDTPKKRVENALTEKTIDLPDGFIKSYASRMEKVSLEQSNEALRKFLRPEQLTITILGTAADLKDKLGPATGVPQDKFIIEDWSKED